MKSNKCLSIKLFIIIGFFTLAGCVVTPSGSMSATKVASSTNTNAPTINLVSITPTPMITPSLEPTPINTSTSTPTIPLTAIETPFAISTPLGVETTEQALWLFETNNNCHLPCWWGITPGQTRWQIAKEFLSVFDADIYETTTPSGLTYYGIDIPLSSEIFLTDRMELGILARDGIVEEIITDVSIGNAPLDYLTQYSLSTFLNTYGQPSEVRLFTYRSPFEEGDLPFVVTLYYSDQGIVALYGDNGERQGNLVQGCPQEYPVSFLSLWSPDLNLSFDQIINGTSALEKEYLLLEEAAVMDVATFYEIFKDIDNTTCLETSADLWR